MTENNNPQEIITPLRRRNRVERPFFLGLPSMPSIIPLSLGVTGGGTITYVNGAYSNLLRCSNILVYIQDFYLEFILVSRGDIPLEFAQ